MPRSLQRPVTTQNLLNSPGPRSASPSLAILLLMESIAMEVRQAAETFSLFGGWRNGQTGWRRLDFCSAAL